MYVHMSNIRIVVKIRNRYIPAPVLRKDQGQIKTFSPDFWKRNNDKGTLLEISLHLQHWLHSFNLLLRILRIGL